MNKNERITSIKDVLRAYDPRGAVFSNAYLGTIAAQIYKEAGIDELERSADKLQAFKDYVHQRLDDAGIEKEPQGVHGAHGCRIGDRLDIVLGSGVKKNG